jgi:hypothetical protein
MSLAGGRDVDSLRGEGGGANNSEDPTGDKRDCVRTWEWEASADLFIRDAAGRGRTASADECRQAQRSNSSPI